MDVSIKTDLSGLKEMTRQYPEASRSARVSRITESMLLLDRAVKLITPVGGGPIHLRNTIFHRVQAAGLSVAGILGTPAVYGEPVEMGTKPHFPPLAPIQHWVENKLGLIGSEAKSVAFLVARKISQKGTTGAGMFSKGFAENETAVVHILDMIPVDIVRAISAQ